MKLNVYGRTFAGYKGEHRRLLGFYSVYKEARTSHFYASPQPDDLGQKALHSKERLSCKEDIDMQRCILFSSSFSEFRNPGKTDDLYYCRTAHIHKSCQNCLKGNPQLSYQPGHVIIFQILLQKECFIMTLTSLEITRTLLSHKGKKSPIIYI